MVFFLSEESSLISDYPYLRKQPGHSSPILQPGQLRPGPGVHPSEHDWPVWWVLPCHAACYRFYRFLRIEQLTDPFPEPAGRVLVEIT